MGRRGQPDHPVGVREGRFAVRQDDRGAFAATGQRIEDGGLGDGIDGRGGVVENQNARPGQQGPRQGDALALATGQGESTFAHHGVVTVGQLIDELVGRGHFRRLPDLGIGGLGAAEGDIRGDRVGEQKRVVEDHADGSAQVACPELGDVDRVARQRIGRADAARPAGRRSRCRAVALAVAALVGMCGGPLAAGARPCGMAGRRGCSGVAVVALGRRHRVREGSAGVDPRFGRCRVRCGEQPDRAGVRCVEPGQQQRQGGFA